MGGNRTKPAARKIFAACPSPRPVPKYYIHRHIAQIGLHIPKEEREKTKKLFYEASGDLPNSFETRWLHPDGRSIELSVMKVPVDIAGELMGTHIIIKDITEEIVRSFITDISQSQNDRAIVSTIIAMAQNLKLDVIAEGIETKDQLDILTENDCKKIQGYYFACPLSAGDVEECFSCLRAFWTAASSWAGRRFLFSGKNFDEGVCRALWANL